MIAKRGRRGVAALAVVLVTVGLAAGLASAADGRVAFAEVTSGSRAANLPGERMDDVATVLRTASGARSRLRAWGLSTAAVRRVDFRRKSLIVMLAEYQPSGGFRARVSRVVVRGRTATVTAAVRYEGGDVAVSDLERPWVVVAVDRRAVADVRREVRILRR
jgi:hypothetical protein